jgi:membrane protease YdiL (CAAX protease family)
MINHDNGNRPRTLSLRLRVLFELGILATLTPLFLHYAPRDLGLYVVMALLFLGVVVASAKETKERIWDRPASAKGERLWRSTLGMAVMTIPVVIVFFVWGVWVGHEVSYRNLLLAFGLYVPWALLQQTIFQFYLLGRLRALLSFVSPILLALVAGTIYGLVHLPDWRVMLVTTLAGVAWSYFYLRDRHILPIAMSHAILGSTFYYFVIGRDLIDEHLGQFSNWL